MSFILLQGGLVYDGSGGPPVAGDVLVEDGCVAAVGRIPFPQNYLSLDCSGLAVTPGFIDLHSHSDLQVLENRPEKSNQGVTTEVVGNCGFSAYPSGSRPELLREFANGIFCGDTAWGFRDAREYLSATAKRSTWVHVYSLVGHGSLRVALFGNRQETLTAREMDILEGALADALSDGACGLSTGLMYAPGSSANLDELARLCGVVARNDKLYATHMRSYSSGLAEAVDEQLELARQTGCRLQISHLQAAGRANWDRQRQALDRIETARPEGIDVEFDIYPYQAGSTVLTQLLPQWALDGGIAAMISRIQNPSQRQRIADETLGSMAQEWSDIFITSVASGLNQDLVGKTVAEAAAIRGVDPIEAALDLLVEESGAVNIISFNQSEENLCQLLTHPLCSVISDGFYVRGRPHPRLYGTFPYLLGEISRQRGWMKLPEAIHKITAKPAARLRLHDRGLLRPGAIADIAVFDPARVAGPATYDKPELSPVGIHAVLCAGQPVIHPTHRPTGSARE